MGWPGPSERACGLRDRRPFHQGPRALSRPPRTLLSNLPGGQPPPQEHGGAEGEKPEARARNVPAPKSLQTDPRRCRYPSCRLENRTGQGRPGVGPFFSVASRDGPATRRPRGQGLGPHLLECGGRPLTRTGLVRRGPSPTVSGRSHMETVRTICCKLDPMPEQSHRASASSGRELKAPRNSGERSRMTRIGLACSPKTGPVIMQIVQLAETRERLHAKANQP